jgi:hypothetical protein
MQAGVDFGQTKWGNNERRPHGYVGAQSATPANAASAMHASDLIPTAIVATTKGGLLDWSGSVVGGGADRMVEPFSMTV